MSVSIKSKFKFFREDNGVYLDSAATTQTPDSVSKAIQKAHQYKGNPGRSTHKISQSNQAKVNQAQENIAGFIEANKRELIFTNNTTDAINKAVAAIEHKFEQGDEIVLPVSEHHSNLLPYNKLTDKGVKIKTVKIKESGVIDIEDFKEKLSENTKLVATHHCSNVLGTIQPAAKIGDIIEQQKQNIFYLIDGAQAVAHIPVNVKQYNCDFYAFSGHKVYGSDGIGVLFTDSQTQQYLQPTTPGGGTVKEVALTDQADETIVSPDYISNKHTLNGGTDNVAGIIGLSKAINFIKSAGHIQRVRQHEKELLAYLTDKLEETEGIILTGPKQIDKRSGLVSFGLENGTIQELGAYLNQRDIFVRFGSHCAFPLAEKLDFETLRVSLGIYNTKDDIHEFLSALEMYLKKKRGGIINPKVEELKKVDYSQSTLIASSQKSAIENTIDNINNEQNSETIVMAGHFLALPDKETNSFYPSIKSILPDRLEDNLKELGMTEFPLYTWKMGCKLVSKLKKQGRNAKLLILANDTTGINNLCNSAVNKENKQASEYRQELLERFSNDQKILPDCYRETLEEYNLSVEDIVTKNDKVYLRETIIRSNFKKFIRKNREYFDGVIDYLTTDEDVDISINILDHQEVKTCRFDTFNSKTGGKFCIVEIAQLSAELFGKSNQLDYDYSPKKIEQPLIDTDQANFVMLTPAMCNKAVNKGSQLYIKTMLQNKAELDFNFINIPLGPNPEKTLNTGAEMTCIRN